MANTLIQIKKSLTTATPPSLQVGELAYSYLSNTLYIGTGTSDGTLAIGGKSVYDLVNSAFDAANAAFSLPTINLIFATTNASYHTANAGFYNANAAYDFANSAYASLNSNWQVTNANYGTTNAAYGTVNAAYDFANSGYNSSNAGYAVANAGFDVANAAYGYANASNTWADATFVKLVAQNQTIEGNLAITGNLYFSGNATTIISNNLQVGDSMIYLAANNYTGTDFLDIGFVANYGNSSGANVHTGLYRDATTKQYYLFQGLDVEVGENEISPYANNMVNAVLNADLITSNLTLGGVNAISWITSSFDNSNSAYAHANSGYYTGNVIYGVANAAYAHANSAYATGNINYALTNAAFDVVNAAYSHANSGYYTGNVNYALTNAAFGVANASFDYANSTNVFLFSTFSDAANITSGILPAGRLSGSYTGITGVGTITVGEWQASTVNVAYGGTGITSATLNGVLFGSGGNGAIQVTSAGIEGQVLQASFTGTPVFAMLDGGDF